VSDEIRRRQWRRNPPGAKDPLSRLEKSATPRQQRSPILVFLSAIIALQVVILTVGVLIYLQLRGGTQTASGTTNGKPSSPPVVQASQRLGAIAGGEAYVKDGNLTSGWIDQYGPNDHLDKVDGLMLSNNVIGLVTGNGEFMIKKGQVNAAWVDEYGPNLHTPHCSLGHIWRIVGQAGRPEQRLDRRVRPQAQPGADRRRHAVR
jgi:hypothetical protein